MQIWKTVHIFAFIWKLYVQDFNLKHILLFEICARDICKKFVYKHLETTEYLKINLLLGLWQFQMGLEDGLINLKIYKQKSPRISYFQV